MDRIKYYKLAVALAACGIIPLVALLGAGAFGIIPPWVCVIGFTGTSLCCITAAYYLGRSKGAA